VKLIVGLGNAGARYDGTRHNVGFDVVNALAKRHGIELGSEKFHAWFGQGQVGGERIVLLKPTTLMNRSGRAVTAAARFFKLEAKDLLVIVDDFALPLGRLRMRADGSAGGHNGLQNIIDESGSQEWSRLRIGIGEAAGDPADFVLDRFSKAERTLMERVVDRAADAADCWIKDGVELAMTRFNGDLPDEG